MQVALRPSLGRSILLSASLILAVAPPVLGAGGGSSSDKVEAREQVRGEASGYRLPFEPGTEVRIEQGWNTGYSHNGRSAYAYDFGLYMGTPVLAAASGVVSYTHSGETACGGPALLLNANYVTIDHPDGSATQYGHLSRVDVKVGDVVEAGQVVGLSGNTGYTGCMPHLHFARQLQGGPVTQSIPVYFEGYEKSQFVTGDLVTGRPTCAPGMAAAEKKNEATDSYCGAYFAGDFEGPALFSRAATALDLDQKKGGAGGYWLDGSEAYSARWTGRFGFAPSWYTFHIRATGGIRVWLDGAVLYEAWDDTDKVRDAEVTRLMRGDVGQLVVEHRSTRPQDVLQVDWAPQLNRAPTLIDD